MPTRSPQTQIPRAPSDYRSSELVLPELPILQMGKWRSRGSSCRGRLGRRLSGVSSRGRI